MGIGWKTLDTGEQALVYNLQGQARVEEGPQRLFLWRERFVHLFARTANQNQYLVLKYCNGKIEHHPGPCVIFHNPLVYESIQVKEAISLDANEVLVVYGLHPTDQTVTRYLRNGPSVFVPKANEWLHKFSWHGTDPANKTRKIPNALVFTRLQVIPGQFYYNVEDVRTADDAVIRVKLMIFYEFNDIETMLNSTQDPIADIINCVCADVVAFVSRLTYMEFVEQSSGLNEMAAYACLVGRCRQLGCHVSKVVFRGYYASARLQAAHDAAVETRTKLRIAYETEEQKQNVIDMNLKNEQQRAVLEQRMELDELQYKQDLEKCEQEHRLALQKQQHLEVLTRAQKAEHTKLMVKKAFDDQRLLFYDALQDLDVNVSDYVLSGSAPPGKVVHIVTDDGATANVHLHHS